MSKMCGNCGKKMPLGACVDSGKRIGCDYTSRSFSTRDRLIQLNGKRR